MLKASPSPRASRCLVPELRAERLGVDGSPSEALAESAKRCPEHFCGLVLTVNSERFF